MALMIRQVVTIQGPSTYGTYKSSPNTSTARRRGLPSLPTGPLGIRELHVDLLLNHIAANLQHPLGLPVETHRQRHAVHPPDVPPRVDERQVAERPIVLAVDCA